MDAEQESNETSYEPRRKALEAILASKDCIGVFKAMALVALDTDPPTLDEELRLYERLERGDDRAAREKLVDFHFPQTVIAAWPYRLFGVSAFDLAEAGRLSLVDAASEFNRNRQHSFYSVANQAIEDGILNELDKLGLEQVQPEEVLKLQEQGQSESANKIMAALSNGERWLLKVRYGIDTTYDAREIKQFERFPSPILSKILERAVRKLRRPKS